MISFVPKWLDKDTDFNLQNHGDDMVKDKVPNPVCFSFLNVSLLIWIFAPKIPIEILDKKDTLSLKGRVFKALKQVPLYSKEPEGQIGLRLSNFAVWAVHLADVIFWRKLIDRNAIELTFATVALLKHAGDKNNRYLGGADDAIIRWTNGPQKLKKSSAGGKTSFTFSFVTNSKEEESISSFCLGL